MGTCESCKSDKKNNINSKLCYYCPKGHLLLWLGEKYIRRNDLKCYKWGIYSNFKNPILWKCLICNALYCTICYENIIDEFCPINHRFLFVKTNLIEYTCDKCYRVFNNNLEHFEDKYCNLTYCPKCFCESMNIQNEYDGL